MRKFSFFLVSLLCLCANVAFATDWIGEEITSGSSYYLYNPNAALFLNNDNSVASTPSTLWTFTLSDSKYTINNGSDYVWVDIGKNNSNKYDHSSASSSGPATGKNGASSNNLIYTKDNNNKYQFYHVRDIKYTEWFTTKHNYAYAYLTIENSTISTIGGDGQTQTPSSTDAKTYWQVISTIQYNSTLPYYYKAIAANKTGDTNGNAYVTFTAADKSSTTSTQVTTNSTDPSAPSLSATSYSITAYYRAVPNTGKVFVGWSTTADGSSIIAGAGAEYERTITSSSHDSENPQTETLYAVFGDKYERTISYTSSTIYVHSEKTSAFNISDCGGVNTLTNSSDDDFYYTITTNSISSEITGCDEDHTTDVITYDVENNKLIAWNAGTATITFVQKATATTQSNGEGKSFDITVSKRANPISISGSGTFNDGTSAYATSLYYSSSDAISITCANELSTPTITQTAGSTCATYIGDGEGGTISTTFNAGTATWNVTQAENYKYLAGAATITATVAALSETCYLVNDADEHKLNDGALTYEWADIPNVVGAFTFDARKNDVTSTGSVTISQKIDNSWSNVKTLSASRTASNPDIITDPKTFSNVVLNSSCKGVQFTQSDNNKYISNVKVTRLLFLIPSVSSIAFGNTLADTPLTESFTLDWSCSQNDGNITLVSDDSHFTLSTNNETFSSSVTIANAAQTTGRSGRTTIYVKYVSAETGSHSATITIYNKSRKSTVALAGETQGKYDLVIDGANITSGFLVGNDLASGFSFSYADSEVEVDVPVNGDVEDFDPSADGNHFYYTISDNTVSDDATWPDNYSNQVVSYNPATGELHAYNAGTATITFHEYGTDEVNAIEEEDEVSFTITVSKHTPTYDTEFASAVQHKSYNLNQFFNSESPSTPSFSITSGSDKAGIVNNVLEAYAAGEAVFTVTQEPTYYWAAVSDNFTVTVSPSTWGWRGETTISSGSSYYIRNNSTGEFIKNNSTDLTDAAGAGLMTLNKDGDNYHIVNPNGKHLTWSNSDAVNANADTGNPMTFDRANDTYRMYYSYIGSKSALYTDGNHGLTKGTSSNSKAIAYWQLITADQLNAYLAYQTAIAYLNDEVHPLSASLRTELLSVMNDNDDQSTYYKNDNYSTCLSNLNDINEACSTYVAGHIHAQALSAKDAENNRYAMYYSTNDTRIIDEDVTAYTASWGDDNATFTLNELSTGIIPKNTVALVYLQSADVEEFNYYDIENGLATTVSPNAFIYHDAGYLSSGSNAHTDYILTAIKESGSVQYYAFCKYVGDNHDGLFAADNEGHYKKVLVWSAPTPAPSLIRIFTEDNVATALIPVYEDDYTDRKLQENNQIYTILGIPVSDMSRPGIYIQNGKKFIVH